MELVGRDIDRGSITVARIDRAARRQGPRLVTCVRQPGDQSSQSLQLTWDKDEHLGLKHVSLPNGALVVQSVRTAVNREEMQ